MPYPHSKYSLEETARRGDEIYEKQIRSQVEKENYGKVVAIDVDTASYAIGGDAVEASNQLRQERPDAEVWLVRVGHRTLHTMGPRPMRIGE